MKFDPSKYIDTQDPHGLVKPTEQDQTLTDPQLRAGMSLDPKVLQEGLKTVQDFVVGPTPTEQPGQQEPGLQDVGMINPVDYAVNAAPGVAKAMATDARTILGNERGSVNLPRLNQAAKEHFGTTKNIKEAGYITNNGELLDLSGRHYSTDHPSLKGTRNVDHRELPNTINDLGGSEGMMKFQRESGAIRHMPETGGIDVVAMPTKEQLMSISNHYSKDPTGLLVDISHPITGETITSKVIKKPTYSALKSFFDEHIDPLSNNPADRLNRAEKMGFDTSQTLYHGTKGDIESFAPETLGASTQAPSARKGFFFATDPQTASDYSELSATRKKLSATQNKEGMARLEKLKADLNAADMASPGGGDLKQFNESFNKIMALQDELGLNENSWDVVDKAIKNDPKIQMLSAQKDMYNELLSKKWSKDDAQKVKDISSSFFQSNPTSEELKKSLDIVKEKFANQISDPTHKQLQKELNDIEKKLFEETNKVRENYLSQGANVIPVHLKMENPYIHDFKGATYRDESYNDILEKAKAGGHDSVIMKNTFDPANPKHKVMQDIHVVFDPSQIRSVNAKFDPSKASSSNITHYKGGKVQKFAEGGQVNPSISPDLPLTESQMQNFDPDDFLNSMRNANVLKQQAQFGGFGQTALGMGEAALKGIIGPGGPALEAGLTGLGVPGLTPEEQRGREALHPWLHKGTEMGAFAGSFLLPGPTLLKGLGMAGETAAHIAGLTDAASLGGKMLSGGLKGAVEGALFGGSDVMSKLINSDPSLSVESVPMEIGLSSLLGAGFGTAFGAFTPTMKKTVEPAISNEIDGFKTTLDGLRPVEPPPGGPPPPPGAAGPPPIIPTDKTGFGAAKAIISEGAEKLKHNSSELQRMSQDHGWEIPDGMLSDSKNIEKMSEMLLKGPPSMASNWLKKQYATAYDAISTSAANAIKLVKNIKNDFFSEPETAEMVKDSFLNKLANETQISEALYRKLEPIEAEVRVPKGAAKLINDQIETMVQESELTPGTDAHNFATFWGEKLKSARTLKDLKNITDDLGRHATETTRHISSVLKVMSDDLWENTVTALSKRTTDPELKQLIKDYIKNEFEAGYNYSTFRGKLQVLGDSLGQKKIHGPRSFLRFIDSMNPQDLMKRVFKPGNVEFAKFFAENFPEEMEMIRNYQRTNIFQKSLNKRDVLDPVKLFDNVDGMHREMQELLFNPAELKVIRDGRTFIKAFPGEFNTSNTAHMAQWYEAMHAPEKAAYKNLIDASIYGIIKMAGKLTPGGKAAPETIMGTMGNAVASMKSNAEAFKHGSELVNAIHAGQVAAAHAAKSVFESTESKASSITPEEIKKLDKHVKEYQVNPDKYDSVGGQSGYYLPNHGVAVKTMAANVVNYLAQKRPTETKLGPLDPVLPPSSEAQAKYDRTLKIAQNPLHTIDLLKQGTLTPDDMQDLHAMYPAAANKISQLLVDEVTNSITEGKEVPYEIRQGLSTFIGQPFDSGLNPQSIHMNQSVFMQNNQEKQMNNTKPSKSGMGKMKTSKMTSLHPPEED